ncbi:MAG: L,D-transpeptidase family protein [Bacteroidales bacterium]
MIFLLFETFAQLTSKTEDSLMQKFYSINHQQLYWLSSGKNIKRAFDWLTIIRLYEKLGLPSNEIEINQIRSEFYEKYSIDSVFVAQTDRKITTIILSFIKGIQEGIVTFDYDEISISKDSLYISQLMNSKRKRSISKLVSQLECKDPDFLVFKKYLNDSISDKDTLKYKTILLAMNYRRYIAYNHQSEYIIVNIPTSEAEYYLNDTLNLRMRTVVGKKKTPTPTIASYITSIVCFPNWNVPYSIAVKEILPKVKKNENYLEQHDFEVVDAKGNAVEESELNWGNYNESNFPYYFRQSTGAENSLGVLKFNLQNPFSIFLHATSWQGVFAKENRFLSHGCIRLEKPFILADILLKGKIDIEELKRGKKNTESNTIRLDHKIPTFIIYMPVVVKEKKVIFLEDIYGLIK